MNVELFNLYKILVERAESLYQHFLNNRPGESILGIFRESRKDERTILLDTIQSPVRQAPESVCVVLQSLIDQTVNEVPSPPASVAPESAGSSEYTPSQTTTGLLSTASASLGTLITSFSLFKRSPSNQEELNQRISEIKFKALLDVLLLCLRAGMDIERQTENNIHNSERIIQLHGAIEEIQQTWRSRIGDGFSDNFISFCDIAKLSVENYRQEIEKKHLETSMQQLQNELRQLEARNNELRASQEHNLILQQEAEKARANVDSQDALIQQLIGENSQLQATLGEAHTVIQRLRNELEANEAAHAVELFEAEDKLHQLEQSSLHVTNWKLFYNNPDVDLYLKASARRNTLGYFNAQFQKIIQYYLAYIQIIETNNQLANDKPAPNLKLFEFVAKVLGDASHELLESGSLSSNSVDMLNSPALNQFFLDNDQITNQSLNILYYACTPSAALSDNDKPIQRYYINAKPPTPHFSDPNTLSDSAMRAAQANYHRAEIKNALSTMARQLRNAIQEIYEFDNDKTIQARMLAWRCILNSTTFGQGILQERIRVEESQYIDKDLSAIRTNDPSKPRPFPSVLAFDDIQRIVGQTPGAAAGAGAAAEAGAAASTSRDDSPPTRLRK